MEKVKTKYISPEVEIFIFDSEDVMTMSTPSGGYPPEYDPDYVPDDNIDIPW